MVEGLAAASDALISVVIACYNAMGVIDQQIEALARQIDPGPFEVLVADNGSTDGTVAHLGLLAALHPGLRLQVVDASRHRGAGPARNAGVLAAHGDVVAFCDADDVVDEHWVAEVRKGTAQHDFIAGMCTGDRLNEPWMARARRLDPSTDLRTTSWAPGLVHSGAGNMALRRDLFLSIGGFDPECHHLEDCDLCWRVQLFTGARLVRWPAAVVHMRLRGTLRDTWAQGLHYGSATAWLRERYADVLAARRASGEADDAAAAASSAPRAAGASRAWWRVQRPWDKGALGYLLWQLGWRVGHRSSSLKRHHPAPVGAAPRRTLSES